MTAAGGPRHKKKQENALRRYLERDLGGRLPKAVWARLLAEEGGARSLVGDVLSDDEPWDKDNYYSAYYTLRSTARGLVDMYRAGETERRKRTAAATAERPRKFLTKEEVDRYDALEAFRERAKLPPRATGTQFQVTPDPVHGGIITITVPAWLSASTVQAIYERARARVGTQNLSASVRAETIALFRAIVDGLEERSLILADIRTLMCRWNRAHPDIADDDPRHFYGAIDSAIKQLLPARTEALIRRRRKPLPAPGTTTGRSAARRKRPHEPDLPGTLVVPIGKASARAKSGAHAQPHQKYEARRGQETPRRPPVITRPRNVPES